MSEARVPRLSAHEAKAAAAAAGVPEYMADLSVFGVLLRHPRLARAVNDLLSQMLWHNSLDTRLRELAIMRIGWLTASDYEWTQHWRVARSLEVSEEDLLGLREWRTHDGFGSVERAVLSVTDEIVTDGAVSASTWAFTEEVFGGDPQVLIELVVAVGSWQMISVILASLAVPLEDGVTAWPPDGRAPGDALR